MTGLDIRIVERALHFKQPAGTSRGVLTEKPSFYVIARDLEEDGRILQVPTHVHMPIGFLAKFAGF